MIDSPMHFALQFIIDSIRMKNYRPSDAARNPNLQKYNRYIPVDRKSSSPNSQQVNTRLTEYEHLAKKAKDQLKQFQNRRKVSPETNKYQQPAEERGPEGEKKSSDSKSGHTRTLQHTYSHKHFKRDNNHADRVISRDEKGRFGNEGRQEKLSADGKVESPRKKHYIDSNEYKKLHEKLDIIENKITDMKKNLQRKKQQKLKQQQQKMKEPENVKKSRLKDLVTKVPEHGQLHTFNSNPYSPRHNIYYVSELVRAYKDEQSLAREHLNTSLGILRMLEKSRRMSQQDLKRAKLDLPRKKGYQDKKTIVFDLDETLIHCNDTLNPPFDVKLPIKFPTGELIDAGINIRPYSKDILRNLSKHFEVICFTASHSCYANVVIDYLDPDREWVHHRLFREHCYLSPEGMYVKDLRVINRDLKDMVLVDNAAYSYAYQLDNGIPILPYYHGQVDFQLKMLEDYLMKMKFVKDVRQLNANTFHLQEYRNYYNRPQQLVEDLYINK